ncbi:NAD dependent epimerase/dehydratase family protein [Candidatus Izimaplasma bacterium HR1]|uniref:polysaccharide biosynthesis C-terminal domain-containing protein n=1 Tax=Candidatus Izimoplasma sp. HR1 TaxID=1541959 RepID=UPI0004F5A384|nr:NAD dependent epimerase/dehydratase family protein [Candidatus Izimaplasma bacterium HR1]
MKVLITGSKGFIGSNLYVNLKDEYDVLCFDINNTFDELLEMIEKADFIIHLAGANRPKSKADFAIVNRDLTEIIVNHIRKLERNIPIIYTSSIQATINNDYGKSKKEAEDILIKYKDETNNNIYVYRLPNLFGKWSRPNYNSVVSTFCHNIANDLPIQVNDSSYEISLAYIDDVVMSFKEKLVEKYNEINSFYEIKEVYTVTLGSLARTLKQFKLSRDDRGLPNFDNDFEKKLYSTYLSYLNKNDFSYNLTRHSDERGSFTEIIRTKSKGQFSVNIIKPGVIKGNHWHNTKNEKFLVVAGEGVIRFRNVLDTEIIEYFVSESKYEVLDIPVGYTHNIENLGASNMVVFMWANEAYDKDNPDTYYLEV